MGIAAFLIALFFVATAARLALHSIRDKDRAYWWRDERAWVWSESIFCGTGVAISVAGGIARLESNEPALFGLTIGDLYVTGALAALAAIRLTFIRAIRERCMQARRHTARQLVAPVIASLENDDKQAAFLRSFAARYSDDIPAGVGALHKATTGKGVEEMIMYLSLPTAWRYAHPARDGRSIGMLGSVLELHAQMFPSDSPTSPELPTD